MWPWGHAAVGYLLYVAYRRYRSGRGPAGAAVVALLFGTQLPDLVDKPLAWTFGVLPTGRSLAHSWLAAAVVLSVAWWVLDDEERSLLFPLGVGWFSHGLADAVSPVLHAEPAYLGYLLWPVTGTPANEQPSSIAAHFLGFEFTPYAGVQVLLFLVAVVVWNADGRPGLARTVRTLGAIPSLVDGDRQ